MAKEPDDEQVDLNLDAEPIGESPLDEAATEALRAAESAGVAEASAEAAQEALVAQLAKLQAEKDELLQTLVRRQADFENFRKRIERERQEDGRRATAIFVEGILPVLDAFERALAGQGEAATEQYRVGFELIYKQLTDVLARHGLERIETKGKPFDPFFHQAVERVETKEVDDGTVVGEMQPGYLFKGSVLRPAMVRVAVHPAEPAADASETPPVN